MNNPNDTEQKNESEKQLVMSDKVWKVLYTTAAKFRPCSIVSKTEIRCMSCRHFYYRRLSFSSSMFAAALSVYVSAS